jgi:hypothetical protein
VLKPYLVLRIRTLVAHISGSHCDVARHTWRYGWDESNDLDELKRNWNRPRKQVRLCRRCFPIAAEEATDAPTD